MQVVLPVLEENVFAGQMVQVVLPISLLNVPLEHGLHNLPLISKPALQEQLVEPGNEDMVALQAVQEVAPEIVLKKPVLQFTHSNEPVAEANVPGLQAVQAVVFVLANVPTEHGTQLAPTQYCPRLQLRGGL